MWLRGALEIADLGSKLVSAKNVRVADLRPGRAPQEGAEQGMCYPWVEVVK